MTKNKYFIFAFLLTVSLFGLASCSENSDTTEEYPDWQNTNETYFNSLYTATKQKIASGDTSWKIMKVWSKSDSIVGQPYDYIIVHVENAGTGSGCPIYTDSVRVHYLGRLLPSTSYPEGYVFQQSYYGTFNEKTSAPAKFAVSALGDGFSTAVQNMHIGDKWKVYIPYQLAYGTSGSTSIPGYSTLIFDIQLVSYYHVGTTVPTWQAKGNNLWIDE